MLVAVLPRAPVMWHAYRKVRAHWQVVRSFDSRAACEAFARASGIRGMIVRPDGWQRSKRR